MVRWERAAAGGLTRPECIRAPDHHVGQGFTQGVGVEALNLNLFPAIIVYVDDGEEELGQRCIDVSAREFEPEAKVHVRAPLYGNHAKLLRRIAAVAVATARDLSR